MSLENKPFRQRQWEASKRQADKALDKWEQISEVTVARAIARAEALAEAHQLAKHFEEAGADAGIIRFRLGQLVDDAWTTAEAMRESVKSGPVESGRALRGQSSPPLGAPPGIEAGGRPERGDNPLPPEAAPLTAAEVLRQLIGPPQSLKAYPTKLRAVE